MLMKVCELLVERTKAWMIQPKIRVMKTRAVFP